MPHSWLLSLISNLAQDDRRWVPISSSFDLFVLIRPAGFAGCWRDGRSVAGKGEMEWQGATRRSLAGLGFHSYCEEEGMLVDFSFLRGGRDSFLVLRRSGGNTKLRVWWMGERFCVGADPRLNIKVEISKWTSGCGYHSSRLSLSFVVLLFFFVYFSSTRRPDERLSVGFVSH